MVPTAVHLPALADSKALADTRERFLTAESVRPNEVREPILASWWRSRQWKVAADRVALPYVRDPDLDTPLTRNAMPVLRNLREHLEGQPISVILTDAAGVVLTRMTADHDLERHLDAVQLAPGFSYAEEYVGTNGIGTALEGGQPAAVFGHEHYAEDLEDLACAGVPIHDPISGKAVGAVDLTCWRRDADPLLIALAKTTADQITQAMLADSSARELQLMQEYMRACRRTSGIVLALNNDVVMMNEYARQVLDPGDQGVLLGQAAEMLATQQAGAVSVDGWLHERPARRRGLAVATVITTAASALVVLPVLPPANVGWTYKTSAVSGESIGWPQLVGTVRAAWLSRPARQRASAVIFTADYSEAAAINELGRGTGLPEAVSGHNAYWWWGPGNPRATTVLAVAPGPDDAGDYAAYLRQFFASVRVVATLSNPYGVRNIEWGGHVYLCTGPRQPWGQLWPRLRHYD